MTNAFFAFLAVVIVFGGAYLWMRGNGVTTYNKQILTGEEKNVTKNVDVQKSETNQTGKASQEAGTDVSKGVTQDNSSQSKNMDLKIEVLKEGSGDRITKKGDTLSVHYTGTLLDGTKFDSSVDRGAPFDFTLGAGQVIQGWDEGLVGMKVGEKRKLTIPASMGYGGRSMGKIPANSTLVFETELMGIK